MKRFLFVLPAVVAGLLAGWGVSRIVPRVKPAPVPAPPVRQGVESPRAPAPPLEALAEARFPAPSVPDDPVQSKLKLMELSQPGRSPVRSALQVEVFRSILNPERALSDCFLADENATGALESMARLARSDPRQALLLVNESAAWKNISASHADALRRRIFREWVRTDARAALESVVGGNGAAASSLSALEKGQNLRALVEEWAAADPVAASKALSGLPNAGPGGSRPDFAELIFAKWMEKDADAAKAWAGTVDAETKRKLDAIAAGMAAKGPAEKIEAMLASPQDRSGFKMVSTFADWLQSDPSGALARMVALPEKDEFWENSASNVAQHWATVQSLGGKVEEKLAWLDEVPSGPKREAFLKGLVDFGASNDIPFACRTVEQMSEGRLKENAMSGLAELWMRRDPMALSEWLLKQPATPSRHSAVSRFAELLAQSDRDAAKRWADTLPNDFWQKEGVLKAIQAAAPGR